MSVCNTTYPMPIDVCVSLLSNACASKGKKRSLEKTVRGDLVAHLKQQKFTFSLDL